MQLAVPPVPQAQTPRRPTGKSNVGWIVGGAALVVVVLMMVMVCGMCFMVSSMFRSITVTGEGVALIEVEGVITASGRASIFGGEASSQSLVEQLNKARNDKNIKAVLLRINSPGGSPAAAQEVYREVEHTRGVKPVVVSIGDIGASGAYYLASAANHIMASQDSDVGSIGVILTVSNIQELDRKIGVDYTVLMQGQYKDIGSPLRPVTPEEKTILSGQMQIAYDHFIKDVAVGRHMDEAKVRELATGLTWPGTQAKDLGLIDEIGNFSDAVVKAGRLGGIKGKVNIIQMNRGSFFSLFSDFVTSIKKLTQSVNELRGETSETEQYPERR